MSATVSFPLDASENRAALIYRPWGTRSLKVQVSSTADRPPLWLRFDNRERSNGAICAFADDSEAFVVSWGGGHEEGPPVMVEDFLMALEKAAPLPANYRSTIFFNVRHVGPELPQDARLTLKALTADGTAVATLTIELQRPHDVPTSLLRFTADDAAAPRRWTMQAGDYVPRYDSRWWPQRDVAYTRVPAHWPRAPLTVARVANELHFHWHGRSDPVAIILDQTEPTVFDQDDAISFECFAFTDIGQRYLVVRATFSWLDTRVGFKSLGLIGRHEVPDAERFDLLFRVPDGDVKLACTDLHWREMWGQAVETPLQATLGLNRQQKWDLARQKLWEHDEKDTRRRYNPLGYIERLAERLVDEEPLFVLRAKGTEAHVPTLNKVVQVADDELNTVTQGMRTVHDMTSTDVRLG